MGQSYINVWPAYKVASANLNLTMLTRTIAAVNAGVAGGGPPRKDLSESSKSVQDICWLTVSSWFSLSPKNASWYLLLIINHHNFSHCLMFHTLWRKMFTKDPQATHKRIRK